MSSRASQRRPAWEAATTLRDARRRFALRRVEPLSDAADVRAAFGVEAHAEEAHVVSRASDARLSTVRIFNTRTHRAVFEFLSDEVMRGRRAAHGTGLPAFVVNSLVWDQALMYAEATNGKDVTMSENVIMCHSALYGVPAAVCATLCAPRCRPRAVAVAKPKRHLCNWFKRFDASIKSRAGAFALQLRGNVHGDRDHAQLMFPDYVVLERTFTFPGDTLVSVCVFTVAVVVCGAFERPSGTTVVSGGSGGSGGDSVRGRPLGGVEGARAAAPPADDDALSAISRCLPEVADAPDTHPKGGLVNWKSKRAFDDFSVALTARSDGAASAFSHIVARIAAEAPARQRSSRGGLLVRAVGARRDAAEPDTDDAVRAIMLSSARQDKALADLVEASVNTNAVANAVLRAALGAGFAVVSDRDARTRRGRAAGAHARSLPRCSGPAVFLCGVRPAKSAPHHAVMMDMPPCALLQLARATAGAADDDWAHTFAAYTYTRWATESDLVHNGGGGGGGSGGGDGTAARRARDETRYVPPRTTVAQHFPPALATGGAR